MGLIKQSDSNLEKFIDKIDGYGLPYGIYQVLECLFRQSLMVLPDTQYEYDRESINRELCDRSLSPEKRIELVKRHIQKWERDNENEPYGFNKIRIHEIECHALLVERIRSVLESIDSIVSEHADVIHMKDSEKFKNSIQETLLKNLRYKGRPVGRYFDSDAKKLRVENFDFFSRYLGCAHVIFEPFFELCRKNDGGLSKLNPFLSLKMKYEFTSLSTEFNFSAKKINNRIENNYDKVKALKFSIQESGLITDNFHLYLYDNQSRYSRAA